VNADRVEGVADLFEFERLNDGDDELHGGVRFLVKASRANAHIIGTAVKN
jgi:hypothetical protein